MLSSLRSSARPGVRTTRVTRDADCARRNVMDGPRLLGGRYTFVKSLRSAAKTISWLALEKVTGTDVVASVVAKQRASGLAPILGARHEHLATIVDLIEYPEPEEIPSTEPLPDGSVVAVAEYVRG